MNGLGSISLDDLDSVAALQTRVDRKYVLPPAAVTRLIADCGDGVAVLEIDGRREFRYESIYFDTPAYDSYLGAAHGRRRRFKVRVRCYVDSHECSLELKTVGTRGATVKERLAYCYQDRHRITAAGREFIESRLPSVCRVDELRPVVHTDYTRRTLVDLDHNARMTFDTDVACRLPAGPVGIVLDQFAVIETKSAGSATMWDRWLWAHGHRPTRISKFGVGMALLVPGLPPNRWNRTLRRYYSPGSASSANPHDHAVPAPRRA